LVTCVVGSAALVGALIGQGSVAAATALVTGEEASVEVLGVVRAERGSLERRDGDRYRLVLDDVAPHAVWFSDRPARLAGTLGIPSLTRSFFGDGASPPNAALEFEDADDDHDVLILEVSRPRYRPTDRRLVFDARIIDDLTAVEDGRLAGLADRADARVPRRFGALSMFLDYARTSIGADISADNPWLQGGPPT
jgi:hypothetical protein